MKKLLIIFFVITAIISTSNMYAAAPQTEAGNTSLYFGLNGLDNLGIDNSVLGIQYLIDDNVGLWMDFKFNFKTYKANEKAEEQKIGLFGLNGGLIFYAFQKGPIAVYISPQLGFTAGGEEEGILKPKVITLDYYGGVSFGVEWWAFENVSLSASCLLGYSGELIKNEISGHTTDVTTNKFGLLGDTHSKFLINFYF